MEEGYVPGESYSEDEMREVSLTHARFFWELERLEYALRLAKVTLERDRDFYETFIGENNDLLLQCKKDYVDAVENRWNFLPKRLKELPFLFELKTRYQERVYAINDDGSYDWPNSPVEEEREWAAENSGRIEELKKLIS